MQLMQKGKSLFNYVNLVVIGLFLVLVAVQADKSFILDEAEFPFVAHAASISGKPIYYHGEASPDHVGTYHPTLYINALALFIKAFGFNEITVRAFGAITVLLSAYLLILIFRQLSSKRSKTAETLLLGLFLLNPYTLANATLPDIDSTVLPVLCLLFIFAANKLILQGKHSPEKLIVILSVVFALTLWTKLTTPLILPAYLICLMYISSKNIKKSLLVTFLVFIGGAALYASTYYLYCILLDLSPTYTYSFLLSSFTKGTTDSAGILDGIIRNVDYIKYFVYWPTLPILAIFLVSLFGIVSNKDFSEEGKTKKVLGMMGLLTTVFYAMLISPFGGFFKYPFVVFGLIMLTIVFFYQDYTEKQKTNPLIFVIAACLGFFVQLMYWGDSMFVNVKPSKHLFTLLVISSVFFALIKFRPILVRGVFVFTLLFSIGFQFSISRIQAISPYPTKYLYGQTGLDQTANYLNLNTEDDEVIWSMKDVGYYADRRFIESYRYYFNESLETELEGMLKEGKVRYYVVTTGIGQDNIDYYTRIGEILEDHATIERRFGNFIIYKSKGAAVNGD